MENISARDARHVVETVEYLQSDFEQACGALEMMLEIKRTASNVSFGEQLRTSATIITDSLMSTITLTLSRAHDPWKRSSNSDRMSLDAIFKLMKSDSVREALIATERQSILFNTAVNLFASLDNHFSYKSIKLRFDKINGAISDDEFRKKHERLMIVNSVRGYRNDALAHNVLIGSDYWPTVAEVKSLFSSTYEIVDTLAQAFSSEYISANDTRAAWSDKARMFCALLKP